MYKRRALERILGVCVCTIYFAVIGIGECCKAQFFFSQLPLFTTWAQTGFSGGKILLTVVFVNYQSEVKDDVFLSDILGLKEKSECFQQESNL